MSNITPTPPTIKRTPEQERKVVEILQEFTTDELRNIYSRFCDPNFNAALSFAEYSKNWKKNDKLFKKKQSKERLVGIETNPGPTLAQKAKRANKRMLAKVRKTAKKAELSALAKPFVKGSGSHPSRLHNKGAVHPALRAYTASLTDPWFAPSVRLGWGTFIPTSLRTAWLRTTQVGAAGETAFCATGTPVTGVGAGNTSFLEIITSPLATNTLVGQPTTQFSATNVSALSSVVQTARVVSGAMRVIVRFPATALRGTLTAGFMADDTRTNFMGATFNGINSLYQSRTVSTSTAGELVVEVQYRPTDSTSFDFSNYVNTVGLLAADPISRFYVVGTGWPALGWSIEVNQIVHYETLSGLDAAGEDDEDAASLAVSGLTMEMAGRAAAQAGQPVVTTAFVLDAMDRALTNASNSQFGGPAAGSRRTKIDDSSSSSIGHMDATAPLDPQTPGRTFVLVEQK